MRRGGAPNNRGFCPTRGGFRPRGPQGFPQGGPPPPYCSWGFGQPFPNEQGPCFGGPTPGPPMPRVPFQGFGGPPPMGPPGLPPPPGPHGPPVSSHGPPASPGSHLPPGGAPGSSHGPVTSHGPPPNPHGPPGPHGPSVSSHGPHGPPVSSGLHGPPPGPLRPPFYDYGRGPRGHHRNFSDSQRQGQKRPWGDKRQGPQKKQKVDKRDLPENNKFVCESCDRGYATQEKYNEHIATHVQCKAEGCSYVAAAKLVDLHYQWQHRTGLAKKIWQLESKEDIEKWKQERRKNYPTPENIAKKKAVFEEKKARGEVIENKYFGKMRGRGRGRDRGRGRGRGRFRENQQLFHQNDVEGSEDSKSNKDVTLPESESKKVTVPENPLDALITNSTADLSDEEKTVAEEENVQTEMPKDVPLLSGGLGSLMANYCSDDSAEEGEIRDDPEVPEVTPPATEKAPKEKSYDQNEVTAASSVCPEPPIQPEKSCPTNETIGEEKYKRRNRRRRNNKHIPKQYQHPPNQPYSKPTLLEQLLAGEIRRERNIIMQCVRHVVNTNFLGVGNLIEGQKKSEERSEGQGQRQLQIQGGSLNCKNPDETSSDSAPVGPETGKQGFDDSTNKPVHKVFCSDNSSSDSEDSGVTAL